MCGRWTGRHCTRRGATGTGKRRPSVHLHTYQLRPQATNRNARALAANAVDRNAGDPPQRLGKILIGKFADVLGNQRINDVVGVALHVDRLPHAAADTCDDHLLDEALVI